MQKVVQKVKKQLYRICSVSYTHLAPVKIKKKIKEKKKDNDYAEEETEITYTKYKTISVFDISQTSGKSLPDINPHDLEGAIEDYELFRNATIAISPVPELSLIHIYRMCRIQGQDSIQMKILPDCSRFFF